jgi:hypothetical protein
MCGRTEKAIGGTNGSLPGTKTIMVRTSTGMCGAALANTRTEPHAQMDGGLDQLVWNMVRLVPEWGAETV